MANLNRVFQLLETENGWIIRREPEPHGIGEAWVARDLNDLRNVITKLCSPEKEDEKQTASS